MLSLQANLRDLFQP